MCVLNLPGPQAIVEAGRNGEARPGDVREDEWFQAVLFGGVKALGQRWNGRQCGRQLLADYSGLRPLQANRKRSRNTPSDSVAIYYPIVTESAPLSAAGFARSVADDDSDVPENRGHQRPSLAAYTGERNATAHRLLQNGHRVRRVPASGDGVAHQREQRPGRRQAARPPASAGRYEVTRTSPMGNGVVPVSAPSAAAGTRRGQRCRAVPDRQRTGERMHSSGAVENRELIGVVRRTRLEPCLHERRLAGEAGAGHDDGAAFPADNTSVDEEVVRRALRDEGLRVCCQRPPDIRQPRAPPRQGSFRHTRGMTATLHRDAPVTKLVPDGHGRIRLVVFNRAPAERQMQACRILFESVEQRPTVDAESDPHAVSDEDDARISGRRTCSIRRTELGLERPQQSLSRHCILPG